MIFTVIMGGRGGGEQCIEANMSPLSNWEKVWPVL